MLIKSPRFIRQQLPLSNQNLEFVKRQRLAIKDILDKKDPRLLLIVGPCSVHEEESVIEYMEKLRKVQQQVQETILIVIRLYFEKPRTHFSWKGFLYDPFLDHSYRLDLGIEKARTFLLKALDYEIATATEFLDPNMSLYLEDAVCWGCIGARTSSSMIHRQLASSFTMPIGFKNTTSGDIETAIHSILSASHAQSVPKLNLEGALTLESSQGNSFCHLVLRGSKHEPNYDVKSVTKALSLLEEYSLPKRLVIDCSHGNCQKKAEVQIKCFEVCLEHVKKGYILGMMLESHLHFGNQPLSKELQYGVSITDPCLDFESTKALILKAHAALRDSLLVNL